METEKCMTCRFWAPLIDGDDSGEGVFTDGNYKVDDDGTGRCRRYPPSGFRSPMPMGSNAIDAASAAKWVVTWDQDWCGEFQPGAIDRTTTPQQQAGDEPK